MLSTLPPACPTRCRSSRQARAPHDVVAVGAAALGAPDDVVALAAAGGAPDDVVAFAAVGAPDDVVAFAVDGAPRRCCRRRASATCPTRCCRTRRCAHAVPQTMLSPSPSVDRAPDHVARPGAAGRLDDAVLQLLVAPEDRLAPQRVGRIARARAPAARGTAPGRPRPWCSGSRRPASARRSRMSCAVYSMIALTRFGVSFGLACSISATRAGHDRRRHAGARQAQIRLVQPC